MNRWRDNGGARRRGESIKGFNARVSDICEGTWRGVAADENTFTDHHWRRELVRMRRRNLIDTAQKRTASERQRDICEYLSEMKDLGGTHLSERSREGEKKKNCNFIEGFQVRTQRAAWYCSRLSRVVEAECSWTLEEEALVGEVYCYGVQIVQKIKRAPFFGSALYFV